MGLTRALASRFSLLRRGRALSLPGPDARGRMLASVDARPHSGWSGFHRRDRLLAYWYVLPAVVAMVWVHLIPMLWGIYISFRNLNIFYMTSWSAAPFIGLGNYQRAIASVVGRGSEFANSFLVTMLFVLSSLVGCYVLGMTCALLLSQDFRGKNILRGLMLLPYITPQVVSAVTMGFIFERDWGIINYALLRLHIIGEPVSWLVGSNAFVPLAITGIWINWPFWFVSLLAALQTIPRELYEAAQADGASGVQQFRFVTLPLLTPVTSILTLVSFLWTFNNFSIANVLYGSTPSPSADVLSLHIYNVSFKQWNFGLASAMAFLIMLVLFVIVVVYVRVVGMGRGVAEA